MTSSEKTSYEVSFKSWTDSMLFEKFGRMMFYYNFSHSSKDEDEIISILTSEIRRRLDEE